MQQKTTFLMRSAIKTRKIMFQQKSEWENMSIIHRKKVTKWPLNIWKYAQCNLKYSNANIKNSEINMYT